MPPTERTPLSDLPTGHYIASMGLTGKGQTPCERCGKLVHYYIMVVYLPGSPVKSARLCPECARKEDRA